MRGRLWAAAGVAAAALVIAACGSSSAGGGGSGSSSTPAAGGSSSAVVKTAVIGGKTVLTNSQGMTLYWFVPDTTGKSNCNGSCAQYWPPLKGPVTAGPGVSGTFGTITRSDGATQATWNGHPLYTYVADTAPGQNKGDGLNTSGGVWHEVVLSGGGPAPASSSSGGGYQY